MLFLSCSEPPRRRRRTSATQSTPGSVGVSRSTSPSHLSATPPSAGSQPPYRMCIGESQVTCDIDAEGWIVPIGGGRLFHRRIGSLLETYMRRLHVLWAYVSLTCLVLTFTFFALLGDWSNSFFLQCRDQLELDKKFVLSHLEREFGTGWSHRRVL